MTPLCEVGTVIVDILQLSISLRIGEIKYLALGTEQITIGIEIPAS